MTVTQRAMQETQEAAEQVRKLYLEAQLRDAWPDVESGSWAKAQSLALKPRQQVPLVSCRPESPIHDEHDFSHGAWCRTCGSLIPRRREC
jgi:hypothetical protein